MHPNAKKVLDPGPAMTATGVPTPKGATAKPLSQDLNDEDKKKSQVKTNSTEIDAFSPRSTKNATKAAVEPSNKMNAFHQLTKPDTLVEK